jgi:hypothetical protein
MDSAVKKKYTEKETRKPGSTIETPFKHGDSRNKEVLEKQKKVIKEKSVSNG